MIFVSEEAQARYFEYVSGRNLIAERGLTITPTGYPTIAHVIRERKWNEFCTQPKAAIVPIVREFYANAPEHDNRKVFVRGKQVNFSGKAINRFFKLPDIEKDGYNAFISRQID